MAADERLKAILARTSRSGEIASLADALFYAPVGYKDCRKNNLVSIEDAKAFDPFGLESQQPLLELTIREKAKKKVGASGMTYMEVPVSDHAGGLGKVVLFGDFHSWSALEPGESVMAMARVEVFRDENSIKSPQIVPDEYRDRVMPVYRIRKEWDLSLRAVSYLMNEAFSSREAMREAEEKMSSIFGGRSLAEVFEKIDFKGDFARFMSLLHAPKDINEGHVGLAYSRRLSAYEVLHARDVFAPKPVRPDSAIGVDERTANELAKAIPFALTPSQKRAISDIVRDLQGDTAMNRLVSGDVGFGKTVTYMVPAVAAQRVGKRVGILFPNQLIAEQVYKEALSYFPELPARLILSRRKSDLDISDNPILFGTTAIFRAIEKHWPQWKPDMMVVDEQQKFSREQREQLCTPDTNILEATATCIPRTAALINYGVIDVSVLSECPFQKSITTLLTASSRMPKARLIERLSELAARKARFMVVYPEVEGDDENGAKKTDFRDVETAFSFWSAKYPGQVAMLHGRLSADEKSATMDRIRAGGADIIITSTVVEIGITIPSLENVTVIDPHRYGVNTLHQLRGRVARHGGEGSFVMYIENEPVDLVRAMTRLDLLRRHGYDQGHKLAEEDMNLRGFGDLHANARAQAGRTKSALFPTVKVMPHDFNWAGDVQETAREAIDAQKLEQEAEPALRM